MANTGRSFATLCNFSLYMIFTKNKKYEPFISLTQILIIFNKLGIHGLLLLNFHEIKKLNRE
ncbi:MAG: hypothetical protein COC19_08345 [SAR86 cluster bacterium]|uniref:Uncharacterized protein n=1 Tax=SAR86 cluster bacterium TaxID=2030880 RepID=A0A2A4MG92_9GAMM|nr:MAG: hypothetical protein COC19_08345 [SAR86 cluster bacterium]